MSFPLKKLIEYKENVYEITAAAARRSYQLTMLMGREEKEEYDGKMVSLAANQIFSQEIEFRMETE